MIVLIEKSREKSISGFQKLATRRGTAGTNVALDAPSIMHASARRLLGLPGRPQQRTLATGYGAPLERHGGLFPGIKRLTELVIDRGQGSEVFTRDNERYLDFTSGIGVLSTGHCHPTVVTAVREQAGKITHAQQSVVYNGAALDLVQRLLPVLPEGVDTAFFCNSGGEAVENALRLVRQSTGRDTVLCFLGGYHGRSSGALAVTSSSASYRGGRAGPLPSGQAFVPYPYEYAGVSAEDTMKALDTALLQQAALTDVAAVSTPRLSYLPCTFNGEH